MISNSTVVGNRTVQTFKIHASMFLLSFDQSISDNDSPSFSNGRVLAETY